MEWLFIAGLGVWVWLQSRHIGALTKRLTALESRAAGAAPVPEAQNIAPAQDPPILTKPAPPEAESQAPLLLDMPLANDEDEPLANHEDEPLLLDTPLPDAVNDEDETAKPLPPVAEASRPQPAPKRAEKPKSDRRFEQWLAENGLAWLAGGAFALGAIFLASFAAQQDWFTPAVRLGCALALGLALIGAGEWARRISLARPPGHPLVAALLAGAGVVALYATAWAAHALYGMVDPTGALLLLVLCAAVLVGLSFLHGQAIGVLAVIAALMAPALAGANAAWPQPALTLFICALAATGFGLSALRRWPWVAAVSLVGLYFWFAGAIADDQMRRALALLSTASLGAALIALRDALPDDAPRRLAWAHVRAYGPSIGIAVSSVLLLWVWLSAAPLPSGRIAGPALIAAFHVALASYAVRARLANFWALAIAVAATLLGFMAYLQARIHFGPLGADFYPSILAASLIVAMCCVTARPHRDGRALIAGAGGLGAALLTTLAATTRADWHALAAWAPLFIGAALLFAAAWHAEKDAQDKRADLGIDLWAAAGAALVLIGIESAMPAAARSAAHAGAAMMLAAAHSWRGWRVLRPAALTAAAFALMHIFSADLAGASLAGDIPIWGALVIIGAAAGLIFAAAFFLQNESGRSPWSEALGSAAAVALIAGAFLLVRWFAAGGAGGGFDLLSEAALRVLALVAAGHVLLPRTGQSLGLIGRWRGHVLMALGILYALFIPGVALNPWWGGAARAAVSGPPLLDTLTLAFAAPAAIAFAAAYRLYGRDRMFARCYAGAGVVLALLWIVLEIRRAFHGADMASPPVDLFEGALSGLVLLGVSLAVAGIARWRAAKQGDGPLALDLSRIMRIAAWFGIVSGGVLMLLLARHPIWGLHDASVTSDLETWLATLTQAVGVGFALLLGRFLSISRELIPARFAAAALAALLAWSFGHSAIRWLSQRGAMDEALPMAGLEGFAHALWPLAFVIGAAQATARMPGRATVRAYLNDLQAIWASAIWPALLYAAFGLWLYVNPWWGADAPQIATAPALAFALLGFIVAAALSASAPSVPHARWRAWLDHVGIAACLTHLLIGATMLVRWLFHGAEMNLAPAIDTEMWSYSALWAVFGACVFGLGLQRSNYLMRWFGLALLLGTTVYVFYLTLTRLTGVAQFGSMLGLAVVLMGVAWLARSYRLTPPGPGDLVTIRPSARRGRRRGRRYRSP